MSNSSSIKLDFFNELLKYQKFFPIFIIGIAFPLFFYKLGAVGFLGPDEPRYAQVAREMFEHSNFITPTLLGETWFEKPALLYWFMIVCYQLFDPSEFAARLPNAIFATVNSLIIYYIAKKAGSSIYGLFSGLVLASSLLYFGLARAASFDMPLTFSFTLAIATFYLADTAENKRQQFFYLMAFYAALGISVLAKGLVGFVLISAIIGIYIILTGQLTSLLKFRPFLGLAVFLLVASIWYLPVILKHGQSFIDVFFIQHHFQRFTSNKYRHPGPIYFFILIILAGVFPWTIFLLKGLGRLIKLRPSGFGWFNFEHKQDRLLLLALLWLAIPLTFFSLSSSKLPGYILPVFPALALLIAYEVEKTFSETKELRYPIIITSFLLLIISLAAPYFAGKELVASPTSKTLLAIAPILAALGLLSFFWLKNYWTVLISLFGINPILAVIITTTLFSPLENKDSLSSLSKIALSNFKVDEKIIFFNYLQYSPLFYTNGRVIKGSGEHTQEALVLETSDQLAQLLQKNASLLCLTKEKYLNQITSDDRFQISLIAKQRDIQLLRVSLNYGK